MRIMGIDEAGRGCVLGPLVVAGFVVDGVDDAALREAGAGDSKALSPARRDAAREALGLLGSARVERIPATAIDAGNLNRLDVPCDLHDHPVEIVQFALEHADRRRLLHRVERDHGRH